MAITLLSTPDSSLEPVYTPFWIRTSSDLTVKPNFRYIYDTYIYDLVNHTSTKINRSKLFPRPDGTGLYSPSRAIESYVSFDFENLFKTGFTQSMNSVSGYKIMCGEEYQITGTTFTSITSNNGYVQYNFTSNPGFIAGDQIKIDKQNKSINSNLDGLQFITSAISSTQYITDKIAVSGGTSFESGNTTYRLTFSTGFTGVCINFARQFEQRETSISDKFNISPSKGRPLTNHQLLENLVLQGSIYCRPQDYYQISWVANSGFYPTHAFVLTYDENDITIGGYAFENIYNSDYIRFDFGCGPANLNIVKDDIFGSGSHSVYSSAVKKISIVPVIIVDGNITQGGLPIVINVKEDCSNFPTYTLAFLNRLGAIDCFNFTRKSIRKLTIARDIFQKNLSYDYKQTDRGESMLNVQATEEITANSNWLTERQSRVMEELFNGLEVYCVNGNQTLSPVIITSNEFITKTTANDKLISYQIKFHFAFKTNYQRN